MKLPLTTYLPLALLALIVGSIEQSQARSSSSRLTSLPTEIVSPATAKPASPSSQVDLFQDASDKAVGAAVIMQSAQSRYDWDAVAELLQEAMTLTKAIPRFSSNYALAQKKLILYQRNFAYAKQQAVAAPDPDPTIARTNTKASSAQPVAQKRVNRTTSIQPVQELVPIVAPNPSNSTTGLPKLRQVKAVVGQFFALDARLDVGMHYREYGDRVAALEVALGRLSKQPGSANLPAYNSLRAALTNYETALGTWALCIKEHRCADELPEAASTGSSSPEMSMFSSDQAFFPGRLIPVADAESNWKEKSYLKTTISAIWVAAREQVEAAQRQL